MHRPFFHGFFGAPNFGDELLCRSLLEYFPGEAGAIVATRNAAVTRRTAAGLRVTTAPGMLNNPPFFFWLPWRILQLRRASHLLIGGGGLIQDTFGTVTLRRAAFDAAWAVRFGIPYHIVGIEVNSIYHEESKRIARFLLRHASTTWCRDDASIGRARTAAGDDRTDIRRMPDLAHEALGRWYERHPRAEPGNRHCVINPLSLPHRQPAEFVRLVEEVCRRFEIVTLAAAQPGEEKAWLQRLPVRPPNLRVFVSGDWEPPLALLASADALIAERFHYIAAGAHAGLRLLPAPPTSKADQLADDLGLAAAKLPLTERTAARALALLEQAQPVPPARRAAIRQDLRTALATITTALTLPPPPRPAAVHAEARAIIRETIAAGVRQKCGAALDRLRRKK